MGRRRRRTLEVRRSWSQSAVLDVAADVAAIVKTKLTVIAIEGLGHGPFGLLGTDPPGVAATRSLLVPINQWGHSPLPLSRMPPPCRLSQTRHLLDAIIIWLWCGVSQHLDNQEVEVGLGAVGVAGGEVLQDQAVGAGQEQAGELFHGNCECHPGPGGSTGPVRGDQIDVELVLLAG